jgi:hypothetical protein
MRDFLFQITTFIEPTDTRAEKAELPLRLGEAFPIARDLPPILSVEATGVCILIGNSEIRLSSVYKSPGRA